MSENIMQPPAWAVTAAEDDLGVSVNDEEYNWPEVATRAWEFVMMEEAIETPEDELTEEQKALLKSEATEGQKVLLGKSAYVVFEGSQIEAAFPATPEGWQRALAYRDDTLEKYDAETLARAGVKQ